MRRVIALAAVLLIPACGGATGVPGAAPPVSSTPKYWSDPATE